jgi:hypothetical protein
MKAVYNAYEQGYYPINLRPEHFVQARESWKLISLVYDQNYHMHNGLKSEYIWDPLRQVPEAFNSKLGPV